MQNLGGQKKSIMVFSEVAYCVVIELVVHVVSDWVVESKFDWLCIVRRAF